MNQTNYIIWLSSDVLSVTDLDGVVCFSFSRSLLSDLFTMITVSGLHARIQKTEENLLITDLDSTNGTFINEKKLLPGVVSPASPGNLITFGMNSPLHLQIPTYII